MEYEKDIAWIDNKISDHDHHKEGCTCDGLLLRRTRLQKAVDEKNKIIADILAHAKTRKVVRIEDDAEVDYAVENYQFNY